MAAVAAVVLLAYAIYRLFGVLIRITALVAGLAVARALGF